MRVYYWRRVKLREKCESLEISIIIVCLFLFISLLLFVLKEAINVPILVKIFEYLYMVSGGGLASGIVTAVIYYSEYKSQKRTALENYYLYASSIVNGIPQIPYYSFKYPISVVDDYLKNYKSSETCKKEKLKNIYKKYGIKDGLALDMDIYKCKKDMPEILTKYKEIFKKDAISKLENLYADIKFFEGKEYSEKIYYTIHCPLKKMIMETVEDCKVMEEWLNSGRFNVHVLNLLATMQYRIYSIYESYDFIVDKKENTVEIFEVKYSLQEISNRLQELRGSIYDKEPQYSEEKYFMDKWSIYEKIIN